MGQAAIRRGGPGGQATNPAAGERGRRHRQQAGRNPGAPGPSAFDSWAELKAAYRLLEEPEVTFERIIAPHWQNTRQAWPVGDRAST